MAKTSTNTSIKKPKPEASRPGVVAKTRNSKIKGSKNYKKSYRGQGR